MRRLAVDVNLEVALKEVSMHFERLLRCFLAAYICFTVPAGFAAPISELYQPCVACHGVGGEGNPALGAPALAGQQAQYLSRQLEHFREGRRGADVADTFGSQMSVMVQNLTDAQISDLGIYLAELAVSKPPAQPKEFANLPPETLRNGSDYYQANCGACHGGKAEGNSALNAPNLAMLDSAYLLRQMRHFQTGVRGSSAGDRYGKQMQLMSNTLPSQSHLEDVVAFISTLAAREPKDASGL
ncbi:MAG: cytochrome c [Halioglobus sp.]